MTYGFEFKVPSSITLVPGETGFLEVSLKNTGDASVTFKNYPWNFTDAGLAIGFSGVSVGGQRPDVPIGCYLAFAEGHVTPVTRQTYSVCKGTPDLSNVSGVTINAGNTLEFDLFSMMLDADTPGDAAWNWETSVQFYMGSTKVLETWPFTVRIQAGESFALGPLYNPDVSRSASASISHSPSASVSSSTSASAS